MAVLFLFFLKLYSMSKRILYELKLNKRHEKKIYVVKDTDTVKF